jgi:eukaryotic-like serine/threonine-protein kinase
VKKRRVGRYVVFEPFARGGMASVHLGRLIADRGFSKLVAVKMAVGTASPTGARSWNSRALEEEARIASRIRHPNVVQPLDFVVEGEDLLVVMEYVHGVALADLARTAATRGTALPYAVTVAIFLDVLRGLHAAHEASDELGRPLGVVHRDVSPQNILVGEDGIARLADFGIAKVMRSTEHTATGIVKGKLGYMPPEQLRGFPLTRQADLFSAGAVLAETLTGIGPVPGEEDPTSWLVDARDAVGVEPLREIVRIATSPNAQDRYATAAEMATALEHALAPARHDEITTTVTTLAGDELDLKRELVRGVEAAALDGEEGKSGKAEEPDVPLSAIALPAPATPERPRFGGRPGRGLLFLSGTAAAILLAFVWTRMTRSSDAAPPPPPPAPAWPVGPAETQGAASASSAPSEVRPTASRQPEGTPSEIADPPAPGSAVPSGPSASAIPQRPKPPRRGSTPTSRPVAPDCQPPFRIDADGKKHYKPECVE